MYAERRINESYKKKPKEEMRGREGMCLRMFVFHPQYCFKPGHFRLNMNMCIRYEREKDRQKSLNRGCCG